MNKQVSVVIPVYNAEKTLRKCVESLVYGEEQNIEIILVDDCSKDESWVLCQQLQLEFDNVCCVQNKKNSGVSYTRNHGLNLATTEYVMFVDSDDWVSGKFISKLLSLAKEQPNVLAICGFCYVDELSGSRTDYLWDKNSTETQITIQGVELFEAVDRIMIQSSCNKIYNLHLVNKYNLRFDETQSMGEDFQFVLDYMLAGNIHQCTIINEPLYYYIHANNSSLMSKFGWIQNDYEFQRLEQLAKLCGGVSEDVQKRLMQQISKAKYNYVYHVVRTANRTKIEKLNRIEQIMRDGKNKIYYRQQIIIYCKEKLHEAIYNLRELENRIQGKIQREKTGVLIKKIKRKLNIEDVSIISQNCIGGVFYHDMEMQFLSPTINLFFKEPDFVKFVSDLKYYISVDLDMRWGDEFPIGRLDDVDIYFMHYSSCKEAKEAWNRRKTRINFDKILVLSTDRDGFGDEVFIKWEKIPYKKILFTVNKEFVSKEGTVFFKQYVKEDNVPDLISKREFYRKGILLNVINSI